MHSRKVGTRGEDAVNARADFQQQLDQEQMEQEALQDLMAVASVGLKEEAERLAYLCGLGSIWKQQIRINGPAR